MRTISPSEFVRRLKHGIVSHEGRIVWFLGAGCSVSSGVEDAGMLTQRWLKELKYLETGDDEDLDDWAESRFPTYDRADPAAAYIQVHEALFYTDQEQQREQEQLASDGQPGFGYATLAQLLTHEKWGDRCNTVITTNFDDLAADALYFYSQRKPQVLTHESFDRHVQISDARPTIVKLYGDAHLGSEYLDGNRKLLRTDVKERLRALATECTLVFVGYGGRDDCILDLLEDMPRGAPSGGVFWVNDREPGKSMAGWLEDRRAVWAKNESFDDLMFLLRQEFELGHPRIERFDQILQKYDEQYRSIAAKKPRAKTAAATEAAPSDTYKAATAEAKSYPVAKETLDEAKEQPAAPAEKPAAAVRPTVKPAPTKPAPAKPAAANAKPAAAKPANAKPAPANAKPAAAKPAAAAAKPAPKPVVAAKPAPAVVKPTATPAAAKATEDRPLAGEPIVEAVVSMRAQAAMQAAKTAAPVAKLVQSKPDAAKPPAAKPPAAKPPAAKPDLAEDVTFATSPASVGASPASDIPDLNIKTSVTPQMNGVASPVMFNGGADPVTIPTVDSVDVADFFFSIDSVDASATTADLSAAASDSLDEDVLELHEEVDPNTVEAPGSRDRIDALIAAAVKAMANDSDDTGEPATVDMSSITVDDISVPTFEGVTPQPLPDRPRGAPTRADDAEIVDIFETDADETAGPLVPPTRLMRREDAVSLDARFRAALAENPRDAMALANYAQFLTVGRQDHDGAEHYFNRAIDADPQNDAALRMFAAFLTDVRRDPERAEDCYRLAIRSNFESAETMCSYAEFLWQARGDFETAGECFQVAVDAAPRDAKALTRYARFLRLVQRNDDAAYALLKLAAASGGNDPAPVVALAEFTALRRDDLDKAEETFNRALKIGSDADTLTSAAQFFATHRSDLDRADALFEQALGADPQSTDVMLAAAQFKHDRRADTAQAEALMKRALETDPGNARIAMAYAQFRDEVLVDDEGAEDMFRKAINLDPRDASVLASYGRFLQYSRRKTNAAEDRLRKAVTMEPRNPLALRSYGWFLVLERNNLEEGERYLRRAVSSAPSDPESLGDLAEFLTKHSKNRDETEEMFRRAMAADPANRRTLRRYARFMSESKGDPNAAEALYRQVLDAEPKDARALGGAAHSMFVQGRRLEGIALLDQAFDAAMGDEPRRRSIDLLLELWFYRYAYDHDAGRDAIKAAIWLVKEGAKVTRVDLTPIVARALSDEHPEPDILRELARVVVGSEAIERLDRFNVA